jgi:RNA polymerase sigma-70 factor, ECF subfamily
MDSAARSKVTELLIGWGKGDRAALDEMLPLVYEELKRLAASQLRRERHAQTLQTTALVHEAYSKLVDQRQIDWKNRAQFLGVAAEVMRRVLLHHARKRLAAKRGGQLQRVSLSAAENSSEEPNVDLIALDNALKQLSEFDARKSKIVELKFFGGMTSQEISEVLKISDATVEREWTLARAWLYRTVSGEDQ